ncbi:MAG: hypothetical protein J6Q85_03910 [Clostridia bacterium]|nr:hypothetical protein [Clostridia bacterium]
MTDKLLRIIGEKYPLKALEPCEFSSLKVSGMKFTVLAYIAEGLGHVSVMSAKGFFGLMKMDTLIINPMYVDLPLYSYDRILAMGNDTLIVELYDTMLEKCDLTQLDRTKEKYSHLTDRDPGEHWYDNIKLPSSISKKERKNKAEELNSLASEHLRQYLCASAYAGCDADEKVKKANVYVNGLLTNGGPSTDVFKKALGYDKTKDLFKKVLFGTEK